MPLTTCQADPSITRTVNGSFRFPLGVYPVEPLTPRAGYVMEFEPADGGSDEADWEEWPDRYVFDIVLSAEKVPSLCRQLFAMMPSRVYPILDILGHDAYREIDPYISYELVGMDRFLDCVSRFRDFLFEDGMCGFGAMCESPFFYMFVDEHKIVTVRVDAAKKEKLEKLLEAFDLEASAPGREPVGADGTAHEHRSVLLMPDDSPHLLGPEEILEHLRDEWRLVMNIDPESNVDEEGKDLGVTPWRCVVRCETDDEGETRRKYAEILLEADCLRQAEETAFEASDALRERDKLEGEYEDATVLTAERLGQETLRGLLGSVEQAKKSPKPGRKGSGGRSRARSKPREDEGAASGEGDEQRSAAGGRILRAQWIA